MLVEEYRDLSEISYKELMKIKKLRNVLIIGGWAAHFLANDRFKEWKAVDYIGSKDIDLAVKTTDLKNITEKLRSLGYKPLNFRFYKIFDRETKRKISEEKSKKRPIFKNFYMFIDLILDSPQKMKTTFFHDDIIKFAFEHGLYINIKGFEVIRPEILLLIKTRILKERDEEKRIKDILDCLFVSNFSRIDIDFFKQLKDKFKIGANNLHIAKNILDSSEIENELHALRLDDNEIKGIKTSFISLLD